VSLCCISVVYCLLRLSGSDTFVLVMFLFFLLCIAIHSVIAQDIGQFFNPPIAIDKQPNFNSNPVYTVGETQLIKWTTIYSNYSINIWQESLAQDENHSAKQGPAIFQTELGAVTQFEWIVQSFQFDLTVSNVFFLWLISPGNDKSTTSHYFNISAESVSSSSSSTSSSTTSLSSTTSPAPTATSATPSAIATTSPAAEQVSKSSGGMTKGGDIALGVGLAVGLSAIAAAIFIALRMKRKRAADTAMNQAQSGHDHLLDSLKEVASEGKTPASRSTPAYATYPVEMGNDYDRGPAELS